MSDVRPGPAWWQGVDGRWYPPEQRPVGWPPTAGAPTVPPSLPAQLAEGGRLVVPVGNEKIQDIVTVVRQGDLYEQERGMACRFVPLIGKQGWREGHLFVR